MGVFQKTGCCLDYCISLALFLEYVIGRVSSFLLQLADDLDIVSWFIQQAGDKVSIRSCAVIMDCNVRNMGTTLTNQNSTPEEIKSRLRSGNACYYSVQNLLSSRLLSKNLKIKIYRTIILPVVLYGCETWSLTLREERKLRVF